MFLKQSDFLNVIDADHLEQLLRGEPFALTDSMREAQAEIENYLRASFDVTVIFRQYPEHNTASMYPVGSFVWLNDRIYTNSAEVASNHAAPPAAPWAESDPRHPLIKQIFKDVTLYHLHSAISPRNIPELRVLRYKDALKTLKMIKDGELSTDLPKLEKPDFSSPRVFSQARNQWYF